MYLFLNVLLQSELALVERVVYPFAVNDVRMVDVEIYRQDISTFVLHSEFGDPDPSRALTSTQP